EESKVPIHFDFVKHHKKFFAFSLVLIILGGIALGMFGLNLGTDFKAGTRVEITGEGSKEPSAIQSQFEDIGLSANEITFAGDNNEIAVARFADAFSKEQIATVKDHFSDEYGAEPNVSTVSPQVGRELAKNAFISVLIAL